MDWAVNSTKASVFILDEDLNLIAGSPAADADHSIRGHDALQLKNNRLVGISGVRESKFREKIFNGTSSAKTILLRAAQEDDAGGRLLLKITPLCNSQNAKLPIQPSFVCIEVQTLDNYYSEAVTRVTDKFNLTKAETLVLKYLMMGLSSEEIKAKMMIGTPTLRTHQQRLRQKTGESSSIRTILTALNPENHVDQLIDIEDL